MNFITKKVKNQLENHRFECYQEFLEDLHFDNNTLWKKTKRILQKHEDIPVLTSDSGHFITSEEAKCEAFADQLQKTFYPNTDVIPFDHKCMVEDFVNCDSYCSTAY